MSRPVSITLRFMALLAVLTLVGTAFSPTAPRTSPYLSGLADLAAGAALAAPPGTCPHTVCQHIGTKCNSVPPGTLKRCVRHGGLCMTEDC